MLPSLFTEGLIPGVLYGVDDDRNVLKLMITMDAQVLEKELKLRGKSFENTVYEINVKSDSNAQATKYFVTPRQTQFCASK